MERTEDDRVIIEHADGRRFIVTLADYRRKPVDHDGRTYQQLRFRIASWEDGSPYRPLRTEPAERTEAEAAGTAREHEKPAEKRAVPRRAGKDD